MELQKYYDERKAEIENYIQFLDHIDMTMQSGKILLTVRRVASFVLKEGEDNEYTVTPTQQKIMFSCLYMQLYNLVESTVIGCLTELEKALRNTKAIDWLIINDKLKEELLLSWIRQYGHSLGEGNRKDLLKLITTMLESNTMLPFYIDKRRNGGNWDDKEIEALAKGVGLDFNLDKSLYQSSKKHIDVNAYPTYNNCGGLELIRKFRNELAHGEVSFVQCGERLDLVQLKELSKIVFDYMQAVINRFTSFITNKEYLLICTSSISHN